MSETGDQQLVLEIMAPAWSDKEPLATRGLFEALHTLKDREPSYWKRQLGLGSVEPGYSAEIVANRAEGIRFLWVIPAARQHAVRRLLESYWPDFKIFKVEDYKWPQNNHRRLLNFKFSHNFKESLKTPQTLKDYDPLGYLTASLVKLRQGEQIAYQILGCPLQSKAVGNINDGSLPIKALKGAATLSGKAAAACSRSLSAKCD